MDMSEGANLRWIVAGGFVVVVVVLAGIALLREPALLDADTPEGTVQRYLQAISDSDYDLAYTYLDPVHYEGCGPEDIARHAPNDSFNATFADSTDTGGVAFVEVTMRFGGGADPFGSAWTSYEQFQLEADGSAWFITGEAWPYFFWECREDF